MPTCFPSRRITYDAGAVPAAGARHVRAIVSAVLVATIKGGPAGAIGDAALRRLAQEIAAGRTDGLQAIAPALAQADPSGAALHAALVHGFGWVMVYGAAGVALLATASAVAFAPARRGAAVCE